MEEKHWLVQKVAYDFITILEFFELVIPIKMYLIKNVFSIQGTNLKFKLYFKIYTLTLKMIKIIFIEVSPNQYTYIRELVNGLHVIIINHKMIWWCHINRFPLIGSHQSCGRIFFILRKMKCLKCIFFLKYRSNLTFFDRMSLTATRNIC